MLRREPSFSTLCARAGIDQPAFTTSPLSPPIYQSAVFDVGDLAGVDALYAGEKPGYIYTRDANPTVRLLEEVVTRLERAGDTLATASGMGAISATLLASLDPGDHVVAGDVLYGRTRAFLQAGLARTGVETGFVDVHDLDAVDRACRPTTSALFVETISNPLLRVVDLAALAAIAHRHGARLIVDHTFATPCLCRPLALGADVVVHSATKYLGGHSDLTQGVVAGNRAVIAEARRQAVTWGMPANPFEAWLTLRGIKTLALRMERACTNALAVAQFLSSQPGVLAVHYPGLADHPDQSLAMRQFAGRYGAMVSFEVADGRTGAENLIRRLQRIPFAPSLGDPSTTLSHPATTSHRGLAPQERLHLGISDGLIRLSLGIEDAADIIDDLQAGLSSG